MKRMRSPTLPGLILIGFALVALPLVASLLLTIRQVDQLARTGRLSMLAIQLDTSHSRALSDSAFSIERSVRQYLVLQDDSFKAIFDEHHARAADLLARLERPRQEPVLVAKLTSARLALNQLGALLDAGDAGDSVADVTPALDRLHNAVAAVITEQGANSRKAAGDLLEATERLQRALLWQAALVLLISTGLAALSFNFITAPLRQIGHAIRALGRGDLGERVDLHGTRDLRLLGQRLEWLRTRLIELEAQKSQFLRNVSHELKTPLTNIREGADLLAGNGSFDDPVEQAQVATIVRDNSIRLQIMIESMLRYGAESDQSAGEINQEVDLDQLVLGVIEKQLPAAQAREVAIDHALDPAKWTGNLKRMQVIFDNLLSNALKHAPRGGRVEVQLRSSPQATTLDVRDNGPGVPAAAREKIFDWFYTGPRSPDIPVSGSGIGLAIAREFAEQHAGRIELLPCTEGAHFRWVINEGEKP